MASVVRWNPARDLLHMRDEMDRLMESFFNVNPAAQAGRESGSWPMPLDVTEDAHGYRVSAVVPGMRPEDLEVTVEDGILTIQGETREEIVEEDGDGGENSGGRRYHIRERRYGRFQRSLRLPTDIDVDGIEAKQEHGVLTLVLPKSEAAKPRRIAIQ